MAPDMGNPIEMRLSGSELNHSTESITGGAALIFVRRNATMGIGHVGWGFLSESPEDGVDGPAGEGGLWEIGAVENHHGWPITPPLEDGYWQERTPHPLAAVATRNYDHYKVIKVRDGNVEAARRAQQVVAERPYMAAVSNCMNDVYSILTAYGVQELPNPEHIVNWIPNAWYDRVEASEFAIDDESGLICARQTPVRTETDQQHRVECPPWSMEDGSGEDTRPV